MSHRITIVLYACSLSYITACVVRFETNDRPLGSEGAQCRSTSAESACDPGLTCLSQTCVALPDFSQAIDATTADAPPVIDQDASEPVVDASDSSMFSPQACSSNRCVTTYAGSGTNAGDINGPLLSARFNQPTGLAIMDDDSVLVADQLNHKIRRIKNGQVTTLAGVGPGYVDGLALTEARFSRPVAVAVDPSGTIYVADQGNHVVRAISNGRVTTVTSPTDLRSPAGLAIGLNGELYIADVGNHRIQILEQGIRTYAGLSALPGYADGPRLNAKFDFPYGLAIDQTGVLYVAEQVNHRIRRIVDGQVTTVAGTGIADFADGPVNGARFQAPSGVSLGSNGEVFVADTGNHRIRSVWAGEVTTVAGTGALGLTDDIGEESRFNFPSAVLRVADNILLVADRENHRIRQITFKGSSQ